MVNPIGQYIYVKRHTEEGSKILLPDNVNPTDSVLFVVEAVGPEVKYLKVGDVVVMKQQAIAQQIQGGFVCHSELVCATVS